MNGKAGVRAKQPDTKTTLDSYPVLAVWDAEPAPL